MEFKDGMAARRNALNWSKKTLSQVSGVPQSTVSAIESGVRKPTEETMVLIAKGLHCTVGELLGETKSVAAEDSDAIKEDVINLIDKLPKSDLPLFRDLAARLLASHES